MNRERLRRRTAPPAAPDARPRGRRPLDDDRPGVAEQILDAAASLYGRPGRRPSLRAIAAHAGVAPAMVGYYFRDRHGLHTRLIERSLGSHAADLHAILDTEAPLETTVHAVLNAFGRLIATAPWLPALIAEEVFADPHRAPRRFPVETARGLVQRLLAVFAAHRAAGRLRADLDDRMILVSLLGVAVYPQLARPVVERLLALDYEDPALASRWADHGTRILLEGILSREETSP